MPKGMKGFQKGRKKSGGRIANEKTLAQLTNVFKDRLRKYGFDYDKEMAKALKSMCAGTPAPQYAELRALLPYTYPKLKEVDPPTETPPEQNTPISAADLMEALNGKSSEPAISRTNKIPEISVDNITGPETILPETQKEASDLQ